MVARHSFAIHAECPLVSHKQWDYYTVIIQTEDTIDVHWIESVMNGVRGVRATQEEIALIIRQNIGTEPAVEISGRHSQNSKSVVIG
jgi:hypothetical protein